MSFLSGLQENPENNIQTQKGASCLLAVASLDCSHSLHQKAQSRFAYPLPSLPEQLLRPHAQYQLKKYAEATLGSGSLRAAVVLPEGEDLNEWLAINTVDFFNQINMLYGTVTEFCTPQECPVMCAGQRFEYHWQDGNQYKKPTKLSAPDYVDALMNWVQNMLDDEAVFPSKIGVPFPRTFHATVKSIVRRLFRVYAHLYNHHFAPLCALSIEAHINTSYRHFLLFVTEFNLIDKKDLAPLAELNEGILQDA